MFISQDLWQTCQIPVLIFILIFGCPRFHNFFFLFLSSSYYLTGPGYRQCVNECPDGYYRDGNQCVLCNANCESCGKENGRYVCYSCRQDFRLLNQQCVLQCSESYLDKGDGHCLECAAGCATCDGTVDYCTSCREGLFLKGDLSHFYVFFYLIFALHFFLNFNICFEPFSLISVGFLYFRLIC